jgi:hypothetical protein
VLNIRTLKVWRKNRKIEELTNNLAKAAIPAFNENTVDEIQATKINVQIRFVTKGVEWFLIIPTHIRLEEKENGTLVTCIGDVSKPALLSLTFGIFGPSAVLFHNLLISYITLVFIVFTIVFVYILNRIIYTTRDYLKEIKV